MMTSYFLKTAEGAVLEFSVQGDVVVVTGGSRAETGSYGRLAARSVWGTLIRAGGERCEKPVECRDEDGHDGEGCTCV